MHTLAIVRLDAPARPVTLRFDESLADQAYSARQTVAAEVSGARFALQLDGNDVGSGRWLSSTEVQSLLLGCAEHGWLFAEFARACLGAAAEPTPERFASGMLGSWDNNRAFVAELLAATSEPWATAFEPDHDAVDEICASFHCIEADGKVWVFDLDSSPAPAGAAAQQSY